MSHANPHFKNRNRAPYELGSLLQALPEHLDMTASGTTQEQRLQAEALATHAENYGDILLCGLESLGRVMWSAGMNEQWPVEANDFANMGALVTQLAVQLQFLRDVDNTVQFQNHLQAQKGARK